MDGLCPKEGRAITLVNRYHVRTVSRFERPGEGKTQMAHQYKRHGLAPEVRWVSHSLILRRKSTYGG